jgi:hypothetical protein
LEGKYVVKSGETPSCEEPTGFTAVGELLVTF